MIRLSHRVRIFSFVLLCMTSPAVAGGFASKIAARSYAAFNSFKRVALKGASRVAYAAKTTARSAYNQTARVPARFGAIASVIAVKAKTVAEPQKQQEKVIFTKEAVLKNPRFKQSFIQFAQKNIDSHEPQMVQAIVQLINSWPDAAQSLAYDAVSVKNLHPEIKKALTEKIPTFGIRHTLANRLAVEGGVKDKPKKQQEEDESFSVGGALFNYGIMPTFMHGLAWLNHNAALENECLSMVESAPKNDAGNALLSPRELRVLTYKQGSMLSPSDMAETLPHALVTNFVTTQAINYAADIAKRTTGINLDFPCPEMDPNRSYFQGHYWCKFSKFVAEQMVRGVIAGQVNQHFTYPLFSDSLVTMQRRAYDNGRQASGE